MLCSEVGDVEALPAIPRGFVAVKDLDSPWGYCHGYRFYSLTLNSDRSESYQGSIESIP